MHLNRLEEFLIHNPLRPLVQNLFEARRLLRMGGRADHARVLEIGCGTGSGIDLIFSTFGATRVDAFDLDPRAVRAARRRQRRRSHEVRLWVGNTRHIPIANGSYDAVFDFGVLHHVRRWREALDEIRRVLKPGGRFYCEEILKQAITHPVMRRLLDHPQQDRFDRAGFATALVQSGFAVKATAELYHLYAWFIADKPDR
jgi:ubiquinone/menaquinone biosynthesis C-methylase UbiE